MVAHCTANAAVVVALRSGGQNVLAGSGDVREGSVGCRIGRRVDAASDAGRGDGSAVGDPCESRAVRGGEAVGRISRSLWLWASRSRATGW